jgi:hypothetical protein
MPGRDKRRVAAKTASTTAEAAAPTWRNRIACVATYNVLEHDDKMDQFEDVDVPFEAAGELKMKQLRFWPGLDLPAGAIDTIARGKSREFLIHVQKHFTAKKEDPNMRAGDVIRAVGNLFATGDTTLLQLANLVDGFIRFPDEQGGQ